MTAPRCPSCGNRRARRNYVGRPQYKAHCAVCERRNARLNCPGMQDGKGKLLRKS